MIAHVIGCGPSLEKWDGNGLSFGVNDCWKHKPTNYLLIVNNLSRWPERHKIVMESRPEILWSHVSTYSHHPSYKFIGSWQRWRPHNTSANRGTQYSSNNSTFMAASRAFNMGANEIVLWGVDFENHQDINGNTLERAVNDWVTFNECLKKQGAFIRLGVEYGALKGLL